MTGIWGCANLGLEKISVLSLSCEQEELISAIFCRTKMFLRFDYKCIMERIKPIGISMILSSTLVCSSEHHSWV
jgi:hypothetical protein